ncbi:hypothetical protein M2153_003597 [Pseudomonas sp. JUb96]|nr:hypothetical protein [Pseudomonas sp. JUb96]
MPEITCHQGHTMRVSTDQWVETLTLDQMRYARDKITPPHLCRHARRGDKQP